MIAIRITAIIDRRRAFAHTIKRIVTILLAIANALAWFALFVSPGSAEAYAFVPAEFDPVRLLTSMFVHVTILHLLSNLYFLVAFGRIVEDAWGPMRFATLYFGGGLLAGLAHWAVYPESTVRLIGASGAVSVLMGIVFVAFPNGKVNFLAFVSPFFAFGMANTAVSARNVLTIWFVFQSLMFFTGSERDGVAWTVHVFGFIFGAIAGAKYRRPAEPEPDEF